MKGWGPEGGGHIPGGGVKGNPVSCFPCPECLWLTSRPPASHIPADQEK